MPNHRRCSSLFSFDASHNSPTGTRPPTRRPNAGSDPTRKGEVPGSPPSEVETNEGDSQTHTEHTGVSGHGVWTQPTRMTATKERGKYEVADGPIPERPDPPSVVSIREGSTRPVDRHEQLLKSLIGEIGGAGYETQLILRREVGCLTYKKTATIRIYEQGGKFVQESVKTVCEGESWIDAIQGAIDRCKHT